MKTGSRQPAQTEAGHGDAQLRRAQVRSQILQDVPGQARAAVARHDQRVQLRVAQFDEGEFGRDKKAVDQDDGQRWPATEARWRRGALARSFTSALRQRSL